MAISPKQGSALGTGKLVPSKREGTRKVITNLTDLKSRHVEEEFKIIMAEDRKKVQKKVSQMRQELPGGEVDVKLNQQDILRINPFDPNLIGSLNSNQ